MFMRLSEAMINYKITLYELTKTRLFDEKEKIENEIKNQSGIEQSLSAFKIKAISKEIERRNSYKIRWGGCMISGFLNDKKIYLAASSDKRRLSVQIDKDPLIEFDIYRTYEGYLVIVEFYENGGKFEIRQSFPSHPVFTLLAGQLSYEKLRGIKKAFIAGEDNYSRNKEIVDNFFFSQ